MDPVPPSLALVHKVLAAGVQYEAPAVIASMCAALKRFLEAEPLRVFATACRFGLEDIARGLS